MAEVKPPVKKKLEIEIDENEDFERANEEAAKQLNSKL